MREGGTDLQIVPATGRELSRRLKVTGYSTARLFTPVVNLEFGTYYLKIDRRQCYLGAGISKRRSRRTTRDCRARIRG